MQYSIIPLPKDIIDHIIFPYIDEHKLHYDWVVRELNMKIHEFAILGRNIDLVSHLKTGFYSKTYADQFDWTSSQRERLMMQVRCESMNRFDEYAFDDDE